MPTRRDVLRLVGLAALATTVPSLAACGSETSSGVADSATLVTSEVERAPGDPARAGDLVAAIHHLTSGLYGRLAEGATGNLALSPYSIAVALAMTRNGANATTAAEMDTVLGIVDGLDLDGYNAGLDSLTLEIEGLAGPVPLADGEPGEIALDSANTLFGERSTTWQQEFLDALARWYGAGLQAVDFVGDPEGSRAQVNEWTAERTHDRITEILGEGSVTDLTRLVLVNALYFKAPWLTPFEEGSTGSLPFHLSEGEVVDVDTMRGVIHAAALASGDGWQAVRLPYAGEGLAMTVLVPDADALPDLEAAVAAGALPDMLGGLEPTTVALQLPKWTFLSVSDLPVVLAALGMPTAFDAEAADFSLMTADERLHLDTVAHQAFIAVDEAGTEAAAATAVVAGATSMPEVTEVVVDRPFLFVIHDVARLTPLFVGRVTDPRAG